MQKETNNGYDNLQKTGSFQSLKTIDTIEMETMETSLFGERNNLKKINSDLSKKRERYETIKKQYELLRKTSNKTIRSTEYVIYYTIGNLIFRPMAIFDGIMINEFLETIPYILRRSNGEINWLQFDTENLEILADYNYLNNGVHKNVFTITIEPLKKSLIFVYGEMYHGFSFKFPSIIHLKGKLFLTRKDEYLGFLEEPIQNNSIIQVISGKLVVFICDKQEIAILTDDCQMVLKISVDSTKKASEIDSEINPLFPLAFLADQ